MTLYDYTQNSKVCSPPPIDTESLLKPPLLPCPAPQLRINNLLRRNPRHKSIHSAPLSLRLRSFLTHTHHYHSPFSDNNPLLHRRLLRRDLPMLAKRFNLELVDRREMQYRRPNRRAHSCNFQYRVRYRDSAPTDDRSQGLECHESQESGDYGDFRDGVVVCICLLPEPLGWA